MTIEERITSKVSPEPNTGCWLWLGATDRNGYPQIRVNGRTRYVTRIMAGIPLDGSADACACHKCDVPACVNPGHLFIGTRAENQQDMARKGRSGPRIRGEAHRSAKLCALDARRIRSLAALGFSTREIAPLYGVHAASIGSIVNGTTWRHA